MILKDETESTIRKFRPISTSTATKIRATRKPRTKSGISKVRAKRTKNPRTMSTTIKLRATRRPRNSNQKQNFIMTKGYVVAYATSVFYEPLWAGVGVWFGQNHTS